MKTSHSLVVLCILGTLSLVGCGANNNTSSIDSGKNPQTTKSASQEKSASSDVKTGVTTMLSIATDLKKQIESGNETKVKVVGPQLEDSWHSFEDSVKEKYPAIYANVEKFLDPTVAGSKVSPLDQRDLAKITDQLIQVLTDLEQKVKSAN